MQLDFGGHDEEEEGKEAVDGGLITNDFEAETPMLKEEGMVPKITENAVNIFQKKAEPKMIGRASMKGFLKEDIEEQT